ncbi:TonB-dependent receptor [Novosphingobium sp.]|uniref:TonB-dependent receptor n=1 Tax=Novosphingobium sp. TaxID=1874826 RepID=UPI00333E48A5
MAFKGTLCAQSAIFALAIGVMPHAARAADAAPPAAVTPEPGEIVVTAQKREQSAQKIGIAVTALGKDALAALGRQDVTALAGQVPNLEVNQYSPTITVFNIRGVSQNDFTDAQEAPIAFYDDEVYIGSLGAITGMNFDLERVEVLRGPQGTLFGRNATGGLVQFVSAKPTARTEAFVTLTTGSYGQVATEGAVSGALSDNVRARFSFTTNNMGGYVRNTMGPSLGNTKFYGLRGQIAADLSPADKLVVKVQALRNDHERSGAYSWAATYPDPANHFLGDYAAHVPGGNPGAPYTDAGQGADANGYTNHSGSPFVQSEDRVGAFDRTFWDVSARYTHDFGGAELASISDYQHLAKDYGEDSDMSPNAIFHYDTHQRMTQLSQELRLSGKTAQLNWVAGLYAMNIHTANQYQVVSPANTYPGIGTLNYGGTQNTTSLAAFAQMEYAVTPTVSVIGGLRYSHDRKHIEFQDYSNGTLLFDWATTIPAVAPLRFATFNNWSGKAEVDYKPDANTLIYASVNRGTKAGGFGTVSSPAPYTDDPATSVATGQALVQAIPFKQEVLTNWEAGFKLTLFNRTTHLNGSAFFYNYANYQAFQNIGVNQYISNHQAYNHGAELALDTRPVKGLYLGTFVTVLSSKVKGITLPDGFVTDRVLPQAPEFAIGAQAHYQFPVGPGVLGLGTDWKHESGSYFETNNAPVDYEPARTIGNVRVTYAVMDGKVEMAGFVTNVTDKWYRVYNLDLSGLLGASNQTYAKPRTWGASITLRY